MTQLVKPGYSKLTGDFDHFNLGMEVGLVGVEGGKKTSPPVLPQ